MIDLSAALLILGAGSIWAGVDSPSINMVIWSGLLILRAGMLVTCVVIFRTARSKELVTGLLVKWLPESLVRRVINMIGDFTGLFEIVRSHQLLNVIALSVPIWFLESLSVLSVGHAVGLDLMLPH